MSKQAVGNPYVRLAGAILLQAIKDAREGDYSAWSWLGTEGAHAFASVLGIDQDLARWQNRQDEEELGLHFECAALLEMDD